MPRNAVDDHKSPISYPVNIARLPQKGLPVRIVAKPDQLQALAAVHGLEAVENYAADLLVTAWKRHGVRVSGRVLANIVQNCIVTLDPVPDRIDEEVEALFLPEESKLGRQGFETGGEMILDAEGDDGPETFSGDFIDVGAVSEEFFALAINPYPRKEGAELPVEPENADDEPDPDWKARLAEFKSNK